MKKLILIAAIFFCASSLKAQEIDTTYVIHYCKVEFMTIATDYGDNGFFIVESIPIKHWFIEQPKTSPQRDLKAQIGELIAIGTAMYIWRDELTDFSNRHDKICHGALAFGLTRYFGVKFAVGFMLSIEATQIDIFGINGRYTDTAEDLVCDLAAIGFGFKLEF